MISSETLADLRLSRAALSVSQLHTDLVIFAMINDAPRPVRTNLRFFAIARTSGTVWDLTVPGETAARRTVNTKSALPSRIRCIMILTDRLGLASSVLVESGPLDHKIKDEWKSGTSMLRV